MATRRDLPPEYRDAWAKWHAENYPTVPPDNGAAATRMNSVPQQLSGRILDLAKSFYAMNPGVVEMANEISAIVNRAVDLSQTGAAAAGSTGNAEVSNETPSPSPVVPREPTEAMWRKRFERLWAGCAHEHGLQSGHYEPECPICEAMTEVGDAYQKAPE